MSLSGATPRSVYTGNGSTAIYAWTWMLNVDTDLHVAVITNDIVPVLTVLTEGTDYIIQTPAVQIGNSNGGNIVLQAGGYLAPSSGNLPTGWRIILRRAVTFAQTASLGNQGEFQPASIEAALDFLCMQTQELLDAMARCIQVPIEDNAPAQDVPLASVRANKFLSFDGSGNPVISTGVTQLPASTIGAGLIQAVGHANGLGFLGINLNASPVTLAAGVYSGGAGFDVIDNGVTQVITPQTTNTGAVSLKVSTTSGFVTYAIHTKAGAALTGGELVNGTSYLLIFQSGAWVIFA